MCISRWYYLILCLERKVLYVLEIPKKPASLYKNITDAKKLPGCKISFQKCTIFGDKVLHALNLVTITVDECQLYNIKLVM